MLVDYKNTNIYQSDELILKDVNFHVDEDQFVYVIGKVGAGKSSLLKTMYCELDLHKDSTETADVLGRNVLTIKRREIPALRREMGIIFQDFQLLHDRDVNKNLEFVLRSTGWKNAKEIDERIKHVLTSVNMLDKQYKCPHELSGGEQQRIAIARALLKDAPIVILDEATAFADPENESLVQKAFDEISKNKTVIMIAHRLSTVKAADKNFVLKDGRVVQEGTHDELLADNAQENNYKKMWDEYRKSVTWKVGGAI